VETTSRGAAEAASEMERNAAMTGRRLFIKITDWTGRMHIRNPADGNSIYLEGPAFSARAYGIALSLISAKFLVCPDL
jgi:hypothetical protein